jgi:hypothetical protein
MNGELELHALYNSYLVNHVINPNSNEYKLTAIVMDIAGHRLFTPVGIKKDEIDKRSFLKMYKDDDHGFAYNEKRGCKYPSHSPIYR